MPTYITGLFIQNMFFLSNHPAYHFADEEFLTVVLANYYAFQKNMKRWKVMSDCSATPRDLTPYNVYGI
jgi:hypothetical protein